MAGRAKLDKAGEQVTALLFGLCDAVMDHSCVAAPATKFWQRGGISQQANPILHVENTYGCGRIIYIGHAKMQS